MIVSTGPGIPWGPAGPVSPLAPVSPFGPAGPAGPAGSADPKSEAESDPSLTFAPETALFLRSAAFTWPFLMCLDDTLFFASDTAA